MRAFVLAPLIVPILWAPVLGLTWTAGPMHVFEEVGLVVVSSLPFIYAAAILIGLPIYSVIQRRSQLRIWHPMVVGMVLGAVMLPLSERQLGHTVAVGASLGFAAGTLFWVLWCPRPTRG